MDAEKRKRLEDAGFRIGTVAEFLELTPEQNELVEVKVALSGAVRQQRHTSSLPQSQLAERLGSSQSRIAKMERGDASVSLDLLIRALLAQGMTRGELADVIAGRTPAAVSEKPVRENAAPPAPNGVGRKRISRKHAPPPQAAEVSAESLSSA